MFRLCNLASSGHAPAISTIKVQLNISPEKEINSLPFSTPFLLYLCFAAKKESQRINLPRPEDFSKALYTFDIGQNDIAAGFRTMSNEQFKAVIPDIIGQFAAAVQVSCTGKRVVSTLVSIGIKQDIGFLSLN